MKKKRGVLPVVVYFRVFLKSAGWVCLMFSLRGFCRVHSRGLSQSVHMIWFFVLGLLVASRSSPPGDATDRVDLVRPRTHRNSRNIVCHRLNIIKKSERRYSEQIVKIMGLGLERSRVAWVEIMEQDLGS